MLLHGLSVERGRFPTVTRAPMLLAELQRCLDAGMHESAVAAADALLAAQRRSFPARLGRARANLSLGRVMDADVDVAEALRLMPQEPQAGLIRAQVDHRLGRIDAAVERLRALSRAGGRHQLADLILELAPAGLCNGQEQGEQRQQRSRLHGRRTLSAGRPLTLDIPPPRCRR